jgi:hypothetical protein
MDLASEFVSSHLARPSASGDQSDSLADLRRWNRRTAWLAPVTSRAESPVILFSETIHIEKKLIELIELKSTGIAPGPSFSARVAERLHISS